MATEQPTHANSLGLEDAYFPLTAPPGESLVRLAQSSSASCDITTLSASEDQDDKTSDEGCGTTAPSSPIIGTEDSSDEDIQARLSDFSLQEHEETNSRPSESAGIPKIDKPQVATTQPPCDSIVEKLVPPRIATVGRVIRITAVQMELDQDFFK